MSEFDEESADISTKGIIWPAFTAATRPIGVKCEQCRVEVDIVRTTLVALDTYEYELSCGH